MSAITLVGPEGKSIILVEGCENSLAAKGPWINVTHLEGWLGHYSLVTGFEYLGLDPAFDIKQLEHGQEVNVELGGILYKLRHGVED